MRLQGKTAIVTGAAGDIGGAAARRFAAEGAQVGLIDRDERGLADLGGAIVPAPLTVAADVADEASVAAAAAAVRDAFGGIDALFVNAGVEQSHTALTEMEKDAFERVISVNLTGAFLTAKHFLPLMRDGGSVVFTSSTAALMPIPAYSAYSASKAGLIGLMRSASLDVAPRSIRCNTVHPGPVRSRMLERSAQEAAVGGDTADFYAAMTGIARMGRLVEPDEVAAMVLFLLSDESRMVTGQSIAVDGGIIQ